MFESSGDVWLDPSVAKFDAVNEASEAAKVGAKLEMIRQGKRFGEIEPVETALPVEFKRGKPRLRRDDEVQLCARRLRPDEMTGHRLPEGALYYAETQRRVSVPLDVELRSLTKTTIEALVCVVSAR